jgi:hypothetical protein
MSPHPYHDARTPFGPAKSPWSWFESIDSIQASLGNDPGRKAAAELLADERNFIDLANSPLWMGDEHEIVGGS